MGYHIPNYTFENRLQKCLEFRNKENSGTQEIVDVLESGNSKDINQLHRHILDALTMAHGLALLTGKTPEEYLRKWVELMEEAHPELKD